jgi:drug/metabolite transporter (DMT)-like permease
MAEWAGSGDLRGDAPPAPGAQPLSPLRADLFLVGVTLLAAAGWLFSRQAVRGLPPFLFIGSRFTLAGLLLAALATRELRALGGRNLRRALATGLAFGCGTLLWVLGLTRTTQLGVGAFINSLAVVLIPLIGRLVFRTPIARRTWLAVAVGAVGLGLLTARAGLRPAASDLFYAGSAVCSALHFNLNARYAGQMPARVLTAVQLAVVGVLGLLLSALLEPWPAAVGVPTLAYVAAAILFCTCLRYLMLVRAQRVAPVGHAALIMALEPVWTAAAAALLLGERMALPQIVGSGLIVAALLLNRFGPSLPSFFSEEG